MKKIIKELNGIYKKYHIFINILIVCVYAIFHLGLINRHEIWRDEAQAFILARNLSYTELWDILSTEGHPILWFLVLKFYRAFGLELASISLISLILCSTALFLFFQNDKLKFYQKIIIMCSSIFLYFNPVISRVYALSILVISIIIYIWDRRFEKKYICFYVLSIICLFQTHILFAGLSAALTCDVIFYSVKKNKKYWFGSILCVLSALLMVIELKQNANETTFIRVNLEYILSKINSYNLEFSIKELVKWLYGWQELERKTLIWLVQMALIIAVVLLSLIKRTKWKEGLYLFIAYGYYLAISIVVRNAGHYQMSIVGIMILVCCLYMFIWDKEENTTTYNKIVVGIVNIVMCGMLIMTVPMTLDIARRDYYDSFSGSKEISLYMKENIPSNALVYVLENENTPAVYGYMKSYRDDIIFMDIYNEKEFKYHHWYKEYKDLSDEGLVDYYLDKNSMNNCSYLLLSKPLDDGRLELLYETDTNLWDERYYLYVCTIR